MTKLWLPDLRALREAEAAVEAADSLAATLHAVGRLVALERTESLSPIGPNGHDAIAAVLARTEIEGDLEESAVRLRELLEEGGEPSAMMELLGARTRAEYELLGGAFLVGCTPEALDDARSTLAFDLALRPWTWRLTEANELRRAALEKIAPALRARFWWWSEGVGIDPGAVSALSTAAQLAARFPAAKHAFERLVQAEEVWSGAGRVRSVLQPVSLGAWLAANDHGAALPLAAAGSDERTVLASDAVEISFAPPNRLVVDLLVDRVSGAVPSLGMQQGVLVTHAHERFAFELDEALLAAERVVLSLPLVQGVLEIPLPPGPS